MASISIFKPALLASAAFIKELSIKPVTPAQKPEKAYTRNRTKVTLIPTYLAAVGLIPTDWINKPILVFFITKTTSNTIAKAMNTLVGNGIPGITPAMEAKGL